MQQSPPRHARPFVAVFVATLFVCALIPLNPWPFSNWELFSRLRTDRQIGWAALAVEASHRVSPYPIASLPHGYKGFAATLARFPKDSAVKRTAICTGWLRDATAALGESTRLIRIFRLDWLLSARRGHRAAPPQRALAWICGSRGAHAPG